MLDTNPKLTKARRLREMLSSQSLEFLMEAHNGISSKIVEEAGFSGIWASGLSISAGYGVRDSNEASWTQVLEMLEFMSDATSIPILVDGDTGYGNFNNLRRAVQKLCQRQIAGICIEDKLFPKTNSFIGENQPLAEIEEFCGKIKAGKDSQTNDDFCLIARVEALISGWGMLEALKRAQAYYAAGADGILIHSKNSDGEEILNFLKEWGDRCPVIIVPTTYYATPTDRFRMAGTSIIIWANHNLRASISAMREVSRQIYREQSLSGVEGMITPVKDIFELVENAELAKAEKVYLPQGEPDIQAVILAASRGTKLGDLTKDIPKCMIDIRGQPLLRRLASTFNQGNIKNITVVRGYKKETVNLPFIEYVDNDAYESTGEVSSLNAAIENLKNPSIIAYGDILFRHYILDQLLEAEGDIVLVVDALWRQKDSNPSSRTRDLVTCTEEFDSSYLGNEGVRLMNIAHDIPENEIHGEWIGLAKFSDVGIQKLREEIQKFSKSGGLETASMTDLFERLLQSRSEIRVEYIAGHWLDVDNSGDLSEAQKFL
ncbi:MAG TPA: phosphoenolpyruvate mutase [Rhodospirillales bacterium]|nr:phosphoenolpyruvate mutase [Rhodospirillales bacterium]